MNIAATQAASTGLTATAHGDGAKAALTRGLSLYERMARLPARLRLIRLIIPLAWRHFGNRDDWRAVEGWVPGEMFGSVRPIDFRSYLESESKVPAREVEEICAWLADCEYLLDEDPLESCGYSQHPDAFEQSRKGVCLDHAMWAWRKLIDCGYDAEYVVGNLRPYGGNTHAWVLFESEGQPFILESVTKTVDEMVKPLDKVRDQYSPHCSVSGTLVRKAYGGMVEHLMRRRQDRIQRERESRS